MELGTAIIGLICVAVCALPFMLAIRSAKKKEKHLLESIKELAQQEDCKITKHEACGNYIIGIDETKNILFFLMKTEGEDKKQFVDLSCIQTCYITRKTSNNARIEWLSLEFSPIGLNKPKILLEFFNFEVSFVPRGELQSIEKWSELLQKRLLEIKDQLILNVVLDENLEPRPDALDDILPVL